MVLMFMRLLLLLLGALPGPGRAASDVLTSDTYEATFDVEAGQTQKNRQVGLTW